MKTTKAQHTAGPLVQWVEHSSVYSGTVRSNTPGCLSGEMKKIATFERDYDEDTPESMADAARAIACWNACVDIPDPTTLRTQRDDLLAAAKSLRDIIHDDLTHAQQQHHADAINFADLVIAKAGGGA